MWTVGSNAIWTFGSNAIWTSGSDAIRTFGSNANGRVPQLHLRGVNATESYKLGTRLSEVSANRYASTTARGPDAGSFGPCPGPP